MFIGLAPDYILLITKGLTQSCRKFQKFSADFINYFTIVTSGKTQGYMTINIMTVCIMTLSIMANLLHSALLLFYTECQFLY
jgi:hypothetical protein